MPTQDTSKIREKIISLLRIHGPSLPVRMARETGLSILFASAFLSELLSEKQIKISNMKVGSSPIYFLPGQEPRLEDFSQYLKSKEREAFDILKEKKFLKDTEQQPAIRVALRGIRDFAIPFKKENEIYWRYFTISENEMPELEKPIKSQKPVPQVQKELNIFDKEQEKNNTKKPSKKRISKKQENKFFNKVKDFLANKTIEILDIESISKNDLILKVKEQDREYLIVSYNKKRLTEEDIKKAFKKAGELGLRYKILSLGEPSKKLNNLIQAIKNLKNIEKIE